MAGGPRFGAFDEAFGGGAAGEWAFLFSGPAVSGELGAAFVAAPVERVAVAGQQRAGRDEVGGVLVAAEREPCGAAVRRYHRPATVGFRAWAARQT